MMSYSNCNQQIQTNCEWMKLYEGMLCHYMKEWMVMHIYVAVNLVTVPTVHLQTQGTRDDLASYVHTEWSVLSCNHTNIFDYLGPETTASDRDAMIEHNSILRGHTRWHYQYHADEHPYVFLLTSTQHSMQCTMGTDLLNKQCPRTHAINIPIKLQGDWTWEYTIYWKPSLC